MLLRLFLRIENARGFYKLKSVLRLLVPLCREQYVLYEYVYCERMKGHKGHHFNYGEYREWADDDLDADDLSLDPN